MIADARGGLAVASFRLPVLVLVDERCVKSTRVRRNDDAMKY